MRGGRLRLLLVVRVRLYREGLAAALAARPHVEIVGSAVHPGEAIPLARELQPDLLLVDVHAERDLTDLRRLCAASPSSGVIAVAVPHAEEAVVACAEAGVAGFVTCDQSLEDAVRIIEGVPRGECACSAVLAGMLLRRVASLASGGGTRQETPAGLTAREREIVALIADGRSNKQIALELCIEVSTVKNHVHNLLEKLDVDDRRQAVRRVRDLELGLLAHDGI